MLNGYCGRILRVDLSRRTSTVEPLSEELITTLLGGRGIAAKYYWDEIAPGVDELGEKNKYLLSPASSPAHRLCPQPSSSLQPSLPRRGCTFAPTAGGTSARS